MMSILDNNKYSPEMIRLCSESELWRICQARPEAIVRELESKDPSPAGPLLEQ